MGLYSPKSSKITKIHGIPLLHEGYFRKNPTKKRSNGGQLVQNVEAGYENSQPAKFYRLQIFLNLAKFCSFPFSSVFCSSFLWFLTCNTEFKSDSSCLS